MKIICLSRGQWCWVSLSHILYLINFLVFLLERQMPGWATQRLFYDAIMIWKFFPHCWHFMRRNHGWPVDSPHKGPVMQSFLVFFDDSLNKLLIKQLCCWWSKTPWHSCDVTLIILFVDPCWVIWVNLQGWMICGNLFVNYLEHMLVMAL